ncbi:30S ribosomal protein S8 [Candidatus Woesearchaeota archaeon]|nr:30S ribosomal protein S8 [Candidatus Woesearchaeota archaeon]
MLNDPLANVMENIAQKENQGKKECILHPCSKFILNVLKLLQKNHYLGDQELVLDKRGGVLKINLLGRINKCGVVKPRFSVKVNNFEKFEKRYLPAKDMGILVVSTSKGLMTQEEAKKQNIGGKLLVYCY